MKIGIIGCGVISHTYIRDIKRLYSDLQIEAICDLDLVRAHEVARQYGIERVLSLEELLGDPEIPLLVNLTPPGSHTGINRQVLKAGKHLFCEKPLALTLQEAEETVELAESCGVQLACAPDTFMGSALTSCHKIIESGMIGRVLYANTNMMSCGVETWHPNPEAFYAQGGGPIYDMGGYYFTALVTMLGPVKAVYVIGKTGFATRTAYRGERAGSPFPVEVPTHYAILVTFASGVIANMNFSFDIYYTEMPRFEVYGTKGTLLVPDPNMHGGTPRVYLAEQTIMESRGQKDPHGQKPFAIPVTEPDIGEYVRGIGVHDLALSILENRVPAASGRLALHVVDIMTAVMRSATMGQEVALHTAI